MQRNQKFNFKVIQNNDKKYNTLNNPRNNQVENIIISAAKSSKTSEVKVFFKNITASEYTLGYEKFCGIKINDLAFYDPSLFNLYPKIIDFIYVNNREGTIKSILSRLDNKYFSYNKTSFANSHKILNSDGYINLDISFDQMIKVLDIITEALYEKDTLKILTMSSIKN